MSAWLEPALSSLPMAKASSVRDLRWPEARDERWRYTALRALEQRRFGAQPESPGTPDTATLERIHGATARLVFVDGQYDAALSSPGNGWHVETGVPATDPPPSWPFAQLACVSAPTLRLSADGHADPLTVFDVLTDAAQDRIVAHALDVRVTAGATATLRHERLCSGAANALSVCWHDIDVAEGARLQLGAQSEPADSLTSVWQTRVTLAARAHAQYAEVATGHAIHRHDFDVTLAGADAALSVRGCSIARQRRHADIHLDVRHRARDTRADIVWRGLADQRARVVFGGHLLVESGADGTDTALSNKNLLLSPHAEIDTRPVLEIHADDVKAAHGATVGRLDDTELFYLRARGIVEADARRMLQRAFACAPLHDLSAAELRSALLAAFDRALPEEGT